MKKVLLFFVLLSLSVFAHVEGGDSVHLGGFDISLLPVSGSVNDDIEFVVSVFSDSGAVSGLDVQGIVFDNGQEVFFGNTVYRGKGEYSFVWRPSFAGVFVVQPWIRVDGSVLKPSFEFVVVDSRGSYALVAGFVVFCLFLLYGFYRVSRRWKWRLFVEPLIFALLALLLGYGVEMFYESGGEKGFVVCNESGCDVAIHWHSQLYFDLCGSNFDLPLESGDLDKQHTHKERNYLHFHALIKSDPSGLKILEPEKLRLGNLFDLLGIRFTSECFGDFCTGNTCNGVSGSLSVLVNGAPQGPNYSWRDGDEVRIVFK